MIQIYYSQFYSHLTYGCQIWGQNENAIEQTITQQKKAIRLISFAPYQEHSSPLFKDLKLLKLTDIIKQSNIIFTHNAINDKTPPIFREYFTFHIIDHEHDTVNNLNSVYSKPMGSLEEPSYRINWGKSTIKYLCCTTWNALLKDLSVRNPDLYEKDPFWMNNTKLGKFKSMLKNHFLEDY